MNNDKKQEKSIDPWSFLPFNMNMSFPEIEKSSDSKLQELKIIESWLKFNLECTRSVIRSIEIKNEALSTIKEYGKINKDKKLDEYVENISKEIVGSSFKNAEMWWSSLESQMNDFVQEATKGNKKKTTNRKKTTGRKKTASKGGIKKK